MLLAFFGLGPAEIIALVVCCGVIPGAAALIGVAIWFGTKKSNSKRKEFDRFDDDDDETAIQTRKP